MTDPVRTPDEILEDDDTAWPETTEPRKDNEPSDVDQIIEENTSVNGTDPDLSQHQARLEYPSAG